jgi:hypothetical protein
MVIGKYKALGCSMIERQSLAPSNVFENFKNKNQINIMVNPRIVFGGVACYFVGMTAFYSLNRRKNDVEFKHKGLAFDSLANTYDEKMNKEEFRNGYDLLRKNVLKGDFDVLLG